MKKEATSYRLSVDAKQKIKLVSERLGINETSIIELAVRQLEERTSSKMSNTQESRACVIAVGAASHSDMLEQQTFLKTLFKYVHGERYGRNPFETICAGPKDLTYDEAFIIVNRKFPESGWVYLDALGTREWDNQPQYVKSDNNSAS